jgi:ketosteroid isomerase-like protein
MAARAELFQDIDTMDPDRFAAHLADDVRFRFANAEPIHGRDAVRETWAAFCEGVDGVAHDQVGFWDVGDASIAEAEVTYTRKDGSRVTLPVVTIYRENGGLIDDYRIYMDVNPLFADPAAPA